MIPLPSHPPSPPPRTPNTAWWKRWAAPAEGDRVSIRLPEGRHRLEVRKSGFSVYAEDVLIRRESTLTLNVGLTEAPAAR